MGDSNPFDDNPFNNVGRFPDGATAPRCPRALTNQLIDPFNCLGRPPTAPLALLSLYCCHCSALKWRCRTWMQVHGSVPSASGAWGTSSANAYDTPAAVVTVNNKVCAWAWNSPGGCYMDAVHPLGFCCAAT